MWQCSKGRIINHIGTKWQGSQSRVISVRFSLSFFLFGYHKPVASVTMLQRKKTLTIFEPNDKVPNRVIRVRFSLSFFIWLPQACRQCDNAPKEKSLTILELNDKVPNRVIRVRFSLSFFNLATTSTPPEWQCSKGRIINHIGTKWQGSQSRVIRVRFSLSFFLFGYHKPVASVTMLQRKNH